MALVDGGDLVARAIKQEGVDTIFTLCGGHVQAIYDACLDEEIKVIDVRHEPVLRHHLSTKRLQVFVVQEHDSIAGAADQMVVLNRSDPLELVFAATHVRLRYQTLLRQHVQGPVDS